MTHQVASLLAVCPDALLDDGLLDVCFLTGSPADQVIAVN